MDKVYKGDIPKHKRALEELKIEYASGFSTTDWTTLRIGPLLEHVTMLERLLQSSQFSRETARLRRGVVMFHSDLVYLRENIKALKEILASERPGLKTAKGNMKTRKPNRALQTNRTVAP